MKTENIYIAQLAYSTRVVFEGNLWDYYCGKGVGNRVYFVPMKYVIVKTDNFSYRTAIDLETKKKYSSDLPIEAGKLYLPKSKMIPFDAIYPEEKANLSKKKILALGKQAIKEFEKIDDEQKKK